jgi:hypothetical protein
VTGARAIAIGLSDFAFFSPPPNRPARSERRRHKGGIATLLRTIGHELAHAAQAPATDWMPRITNYPY